MPSSFLPPALDVYIQVATHHMTASMYTKQKCPQTTRFVMSQVTFLRCIIMMANGYNLWPDDDIFIDYSKKRW